MKRKMLLSLFMVFVFSCFAGCGTTTLQYIKNNMSEKTDVYFFGENEEFYCSISSGSREKKYIMDGQHSECVDFSLLSLTFAKNIEQTKIKVLVVIDNNESDCVLEINSLSSAYMFDLERKLTGSEKISVSFQNKSVELNCLSKDFVVSSENAVDIASRELESKIMLKKSFSNLNAECYLRVLDKKANNFDKIFWCFTVINTSNENYSVIISTEDGGILAKSE